MNENEELLVLFHAALLGRTDIVKNAITAIKNRKSCSDEELAKILSTSREEDQASPLHIATQFGHSDVIRALLNAGADLSVTPNNGEYKDKRPYDLSADKPKTREVYHVYFFEQVAQGRNLFKLQQLLDGGVSVDLVDNSAEKDSALHWACAFDHIHVAKLLLINQCNINIANALQQTALHIACKRLCIDMVELLLAEGVDVTALDADQRTAKDYIQASIDSTTTDTSTTKVELLQKILDALNGFQAATYPLNAEREALQQRKRELLLEKQKQLTDHTASHNCTVETNEIPPDMIDVDVASQDDSASDADVDLSSQYKFWPPVQQFRLNAGTCCELDTSEQLTISLTNASDDLLDIFPLLSYSQLLQVLDNHHFQVQVKRHYSTAAQICISIDSNVCPISQSYVIDINTDYINVIGHDYTSILYALYTLIQVLTMNSTATQTTTTIEDTLKTTVKLQVPLLYIYDFPAIPRRSVLYTFTYLLQMQAHLCKELLLYLARIKLNMIYLLVDSEEQLLETIQTIHGAGDDVRENKEKEFYGNSFAIDELCRRNCISLVPTLHITSTSYKLPSELLATFSHSMVSVIFAFSDNGSDGDGERQCVEKVLAALSQHGFSTIQVIQHTNTDLSIKRIARQLGVAIVEKQYKDLFPGHIQHLRNIATISTDTIKHTTSYIHQVIKSKQPQSVFPLYFEADYFYPTLLLKYQALIYSGMAWNIASAANATSTTVIQDVIEYFLLSNTHNTFTSTSNQSNNLDKVNTVKSLFTNPVSDLLQSTTIPAAAHNMSSNSILGSSSVELDHHHGHSGQTHDCAAVERLLWQLLGINTYSAPSQPPSISRSQLAVLLKVYKKLLTAAKWKGQSNNNIYNTPTANGNTNANANASTSSSGLLSFMTFNLLSGASTTSSTVTNNKQSHSHVNLVELEVEEVLVSMHLHSILVKAILTATNKNSKPTASEVVMISTSKDDIRTLLTSQLTIGSKSDIANSVLESIGYHIYTLKQKYHGEFIAYLQRQARESLVLTTTNSHASNDSLQHQFRVLLPALIALNDISHGLMKSKTVDDFIDRIFK